MAEESDLEKRLREELKKEAGKAKPSPDALKKIQDKIKGKGK